MLSRILKVWLIATFLFLVIVQSFEHSGVNLQTDVQYNNGLYSGSCEVIDGQKRCVFYLTRWIGGVDLKGGPTQYKPMVDEIRNMGPNDRFILYVAGYGGRVDVYEYIKEAVHSSRGHFYTIMDGDTYSAHSMILLLGERVGYTGNFRAMFHLPFYTDRNGNNILLCGREKDWDSNDMADYKEFTETVAPYLTLSDMTKFHQCQEVYVTAEELHSRAPQQFRPLQL